MALVLPLLLLILTGIVDMGRLLHQQIQLTQAAREGARLGALNGTADQVRAKVTAVAGARVTLTYPTGGVAVCAAASQLGNDSTVRVQHTFQPATPLLAWISRSSPITVSAKGVMSCVG
ncbi:hypothetical protein Ait01nite_014520 [Actinoplanes italicus]|uniref:TadE-like protein n=2 Tax=Actinoplanes italicus TaxID=113567 RepID=A0A2T0KHH8_9ACTN|nr:TadE-like protein [Actinoplanes italicus]GIE28407.1 hypothetical protein Ait01nite_014520 [Actinoplanes italicus]